MADSRLPIQPPAMKTYVATTGAIFLVVTVLHVVRAHAEPHLIHDHWFWAITLLTFALSIWAWVVFRKTPRS